MKRSSNGNGSAEAPEATQAAVEAPEAEGAPQVAEPANGASVSTGGANGGGAGLLTRMYGLPERRSPEERDREAAMEFAAACGPAMDVLRRTVPDAASPDEAMRSLVPQGDYPPDPDGGALLPGDAYDTDRRVYYRLLRRDYEMNPRPARPKRNSHFLHDVYGRLPGIKGW